VNLVRDQGLPFPAFSPALSLRRAVPEVSSEHFHRYTLKVKANRGGGTKSKG